MKVSELLTDESKWCKGVIARNAAGEECKPNDPLAICWCVAGAILKCYGAYGMDAIHKVRQYLNIYKHDVQIGELNDSYTWQQMDKLIKGSGI